MNVKKKWLSLIFGLGIAALMPSCKSTHNAASHKTELSVDEHTAIILKQKMSKQYEDLKAALPNIRMRNGNWLLIRISFDSDTLFIANSSSVNTSAQPTLNTLARALGADQKIFIQTYRSDEPTQIDTLYQALANKRRETVAHYLEEGGISPSHIMTQQIIRDDYTDPCQHRLEVWVVPSSQMIDEAKRTKH